MIKRLCPMCKGYGYDIVRTEEQQAIFEIWFWACMNRVRDKQLMSQLKEILKRNLDIKFPESTVSTGGKGK